MSKNKNSGKKFESSVESACKKRRIFYFRIRDVNPAALKSMFAIPKNKYDSLIYYKKHLFAIEMKSVNAKSISFSESMIKENQIKNLQEASTYDGVIAGFLFNFRKDVNKTYFVNVFDFIKYKECAESESCGDTYKGRLNRSSIPISICEEIGIELKSRLKKVNYDYYISEMLDEVIEKYKSNKTSLYTNKYNQGDANGD